MLISVQNRLSKKSGHGKRLIVEVDLLTKECSHDHSNEAYCELIGSDRVLLKELWSMGCFAATSYSRGLVTRMVPRDREGRFSTELFARYQRVLAGTRSRRDPV